MNITTTNLANLYEELLGILEDSDFTNIDTINWLASEFSYEAECKAEELHTAFLDELEVKPKTIKEITTS